MNHSGIGKETGYAAVTPYELAYQTSASERTDPVGPNNHQTEAKVARHREIPDMVGSEPQVISNEIPKWPTEPARLELGFFSRLGRSALEVTMVLLPLGFAVLGILIIDLRGASQSAYGDAILEATQVAPTLWPLVFSAIVGSMLRTLAHRKMQQGGTIGLIEQLMGSNTVFAALMKGLTLRPFSLATPILFILWGLSPFGGQAILRSIERVMETETENVPLSYMSLNPRNSDAFDVRPGRTSSTSAQNGPNILFGTGLISVASSLHEMNGTRQQDGFDKLVTRLGGMEPTVQASLRDLFNHPRIPIVDLLPDYDEARFQDGEWFDVPKDRVLSYSSGFGIPILQLPPANVGNASFTIQTAYTRFKCDDEWQTGSDFQRYLNRTEDSFESWVEGDDPPGDAGPAIHQFATTMPFDRTAGPDSPNGTNCDIAERPLLFYNTWGTADRYGLNCYPRTVYLEVDIGCSRAADNERLQCAARRVRQSQDTTLLCPSITEFEFYRSYNPFGYMMNLFRFGQDGTPPSGAEQFLINPSLIWKNGTLTNIYVSELDYIMTWVEPSVLSSRLTMLWNTWSMATKDNGLISGSELSISTAVNWNPASGPPSILANESSATWTYEAGRIYHVQTTWISLYMASVFVLFVCSLYGAYIKFRLDIPEVLGGVAGFTRDNPYIQLPTAGSTLNTSERAVLLRNVSIQMKDVKEGEEVGRLVIASCSDNNKDRVPLDRGKLYE